jgi:hypothetical protein
LFTYYLPAPTQGAPRARGSGEGLMCATKPVTEHTTKRDMNSSQSCCWSIKASEILRCVNWSMVTDVSSRPSTFEMAETIYHWTRRNIHGNDHECLRYVQLLKSNVLHVPCFGICLDSLHGVTVLKTASPFFDTAPVHLPKHFFASNAQLGIQFTVILSQLPLTDPPLSASALWQES